MKHWEFLEVLYEEFSIPNLTDQSQSAKNYAFKLWSVLKQVAIWGTGITLKFARSSLIAPFWSMMMFDYGISTSKCCSECLGR